MQGTEIMVLTGPSSPVPFSLVRSVLCQKLRPYRYWVWGPYTPSGKERLKRAPCLRSLTGLKHFPSNPAQMETPAQSPLIAGWTVSLLRSDHSLHPKLEELFGRKLLTVKSKTKCFIIYDTWGWERPEIKIDTLYVSGSFLSNKGTFSKKKKKFFNKLCRGCWCQLRSEEEEEATGRGKQSSRICQLSFFLVSTNGEVSRGSPRIQTMWQWILKGISNESNCWRPHPFLLTMGFAILCISWRLRHGNKMWSLLLWQTQHKHDFLSFQSNSLMFSNFLKTSPVELPASQMKCSHLKVCLCLLSKTLAAQAGVFSHLLF